MIGNLVKGQRPRGLIDYLLADRDHNGEVRPEAIVIGGTILGDDTYSITAQFTRWMQLNPDARDPIVHESLSPADGDRKLTHEEMAEIGRYWAESMGFEAYTIFSHGDHLHIAALRIRSNGTLVSTWQDYGRSEGHVREIEEKFNLEKVEASHLLEPERAANHRRATTKGQAAYIEITGELPPAQRVAAAIDAILADKPTRDEFEQRLAEYGINARANVASTGKLNGYAYDIGGIVVTSKAIGRGYTLSNLQKRGLNLTGGRKNEQDQQLTATGPREGRGNPANPQGNQRVAGSDRAGARKNVAGNQRVASSGVFPGGATTAGPRPADRSRVDARRPRHGNAEYPENTHELVKENCIMETASISPAPVGPGHHLANAGTTPSIRRREGGGADVWWPLSDADLYAAGLPGVAWWKYRDIEGAAGGVAEPQLLIGLHDGAQIELRRDSVSATTATPAAEVAMLALAQKRGWTAVTVAGDEATKERLARELLSQGVNVVNPELAQYCARVRAELVTGDTLSAPIPAQPAAPTTTIRPKLNLFGWREKRQPSPAPAPAPVPQAVAEQPTATGHQVDTAPPVPVAPTAEEIEAAARAAASLDDVDGVMGYRHRIDAYRLSELATDDQRMRAYYRDMLDADERGYPWRGAARDALQALERDIQSGNLDDANDKLYDAWLAMEPEELQLVRRYVERVDELREERKHDDIRPS